MESPTASEDRVETAVPRQEPVSRKKPRDTRRAQLFEATIETLARRGYARMTLGDVARAAAEHAPDIRNQEADVQDVNLVRQDAILEAILKDHDVVVGDGTADERGHGGRGTVFDAGL